MKKVFVLVVAAILVFSTLQIIAQDGVSFKDLDSVPWAEDAVLELVSLGIIKGTSSDT
ncbi:MAG: S-layer homology domain-containing protein, partial [Clostridiaceae bacterium]|nr:S-layer homology domain-containing protein [Clostridiaceae bacterium]